MTIPLLVLRADGEALVERLRALGRHAMAAPVLRHEAAPGALNAWRGRACTLLIASPRGAERLIAEGCDPAWRVYALAPSTSARLREAGIQVHLEVHGGGRALAAAAPAGPLVALTSDLGGAEVLAVRPDARIATGYRTLPVERPPELPPGRFDALFTSPSTVTAFWTLGLAQGGHLRRSFAFGDTTTAALLGVGQIPVVVTLNPLSPILLES